MKCHKCSGKAIIKINAYSGSLCSGCFSKGIEQRVRKNTRLNKVFKSGDRILIIDDESFDSFNCKYLIKKIIKKLPVEILVKRFDGNFFNNKEIKNFVKKNKIDRVVVPWDLDREIELFLSYIFSNKKIKDVGFVVDKKYVKLLRNITEEESKLFAIIHDFKCSGFKRKKSAIAKMLDDVEKKYPGTKFGLLKSIDFVVR